MIQVLFTSFNAQFPAAQWQSLLRQVPVALQQRITRYVRWQDRQAGLLGKLLLWQGLTAAGYPADCLTRLAYNAYGRPWLDPQLDFNLSHSGRFVVCALAAHGRVGIDIEHRRELVLSDFTRYMTPPEWQCIHRASHPDEQFFAYWTRKESVMKADGRGLSIPLQEIVLDGETATLAQTTWFLKEVRLDAEYTCYLATDCKDAAIHLTPVYF